MRETATRADQQSGRTTAGMRWAVAAVAVVVAAGLTWAAWMSFLADADADADAAGAPRATAGPLAGGSAASPLPTPVDGGEVLPPGQQQVIDRIPALPGITPRVTAPLPADATGLGELVDGYPAEIAGPLSADDVIASSISSQATRMQVGLTARTGETPETVTAHYRQLWTGLGLAPSGETPGSLAFSDSYTSITLAVSETGTGTAYSIFATLRTE